MANNGWISNFKVSIEAYGHSASNYHFRIFKKPKIKLKKFQKIKNIYKEATNKKSYIKTKPPKVGMLIQNTISKFSKTKHLTKKDPLKFQKNQ